MRLYIAPNTIAVVVAVTLEEAGLAYDPVMLNYATADQTKPDYLAINSKGRVPALTTEHGILTETGAILDYIAALAPGARLVPDDAYQAAKMRSVMYYLASTMHVNHAHKMRGHRWADRPESHADMAAKVPETMAASARFVEEECLAGPFVLGDRLSLADPYLFMLCSWLASDDVDLAPFPGIRAFLDRMEARPSVKAVRAYGMLTL